MGKGEIARNEQFLLFPLFSTRLDNFLLFSSDLKLSSADYFKLDLSKILSSGNGLTEVCPRLEFVNPHSKQHQGHDNTSTFCSQKAV